MSKNKRLLTGGSLGCAFSLIWIVLPIWALQKLYLVAQWENLIDFPHLLEHYLERYIPGEITSFAVGGTAGILVGSLAAVICQRKWLIRSLWLAAGITGLTLGYFIEVFFHFLDMFEGPYGKPYYITVIIMAVGLILVSINVSMRLNPELQIVPGLKNRNLVKLGLIALLIVIAIIVAFGGIRYVDRPLSRIAFFKPELEDNLLLFASPSTIAVKDNYAYITDNKNGLIVLDITNPVEPHFVSATEVPSISNMIVKDSYAYLTTWGFMFTGELIIIDISDPAKPRIVHQGNQGNWHGLDMTDKYIYGANDKGSGLQIIDISDPTLAVPVGYLELTKSHGRINDVAVKDNYAYLALKEGDALEHLGYENHGLWVVDVSDPTNPVDVDFYNVIENGYELIIANDYLYSIDLYGEINIFDISNVVPEKISTVETRLFLSSVFIEEDNLYLCTNWELQIFDVSNPVKPIPIDKYWVSRPSANNSSCDGIVVKDDYVYWIGEYYPLFSLERVSIFDELGGVGILKRNFH